MSSLASRNRPFRYAAVKQVKSETYSISTGAASSSSLSVATSAEFIACPSSSKGGIHMLPTRYSSYKRSQNPPIISGHGGDLTDINFASTNDYLLASSGSEGSVKLWNIEKEGLTAPLSSSTVKFDGAFESVNNVKFHPTTDTALGNSTLLILKTVEKNDIMNESYYTMQIYICMCVYLSMYSNRL